MSDADGGVEESLESSGRIALTVAIQAGERIARLITESLAEAKDRAAREAAEIRARFESEKAVAQAKFAVVDNPEWWDKATIRDVTGVVETARAWRDVAPEFAHADSLIAREVRERYGVDVTTVQAVVRETPSELDLAKRWAENSAPEHYHRHDHDRLHIVVDGEEKPHPAAERTLINDYRAAKAGDVATLELSAAEEWKRETDPVGYGDYRSETALRFDESGRAFPQHEATAEAARIELVREWHARDTGAGSSADSAEATERSKSQRDVTEAEAMMTEANRLDRENDRAAAVGQDDNQGRADLTGRASELDKQADSYERDAAAGGSGDRSPDELRELAADARAQASLLRDEVSTPPRTEEAASEASAHAHRDAGAVAYDSAERRAGTAAAMRVAGVEDKHVDARMTVDASFATPPSGVAPSGRTSVPRTRSRGGQGRTAEKSEQSR